MEEKTPSKKYKKITQTLNFIARKQEGCKIDKLKAIKLVWVADRYHIRKYGRPLSWDTYEAMKLGPVGSNTKDIADGCSTFLGKSEREYSEQYVKAVYKNFIKSVQEPDYSYFSESDIEALNFALKEFNSMGAIELAKLSHEYPEWKKHENTLQNLSERKVRMDYLDFFENPKGIEDRFKVDKNLLEESKQQYIESQQLKEILVAVSTS